MDLSRFFLIILARHKLILLTLIVTVATTLVVSLLLPKNYKSVATLVLTNKGADPVTGVIMPAQLNASYMATQLDVIKSSRIALMVIDQLRLDQSEAVKAQFESSNSNLGLRDWLAAWLVKNLDIETSRDSNVIGIGFKGADPMFTSIIANAFANAYQEMSIRLTVEPSQRAAAYFTEQLNVLGDRLEVAQKKLSQFQHEQGIVDVDYRLDVETKRLNDLSSQLIVAQAEVMGAVSGAKNNSSDGEKNSISRNPMINNLKFSLTQAESSFSEISQKLGRNHPSYAGAKAEVEKLRAELNKHIRVVTNTAINQESGIRMALEEQKAKVLALNRARDELLPLVKDVEGAQQAYNAAMQRLNQTSLEGQSNLSSVSILDTAKIPDTPDSPKILLNIILSVFLGSALALGVGLLAEMLDRRVRSAEDLVDILQVPVLGIIKRGVPKQQGRLQLGWLRLLR
ncbi:chain length determinant protein EpsF [Nitrosomonas sp. Is79A3]|uniref:chain length determinant protein EpsF n=1 Tax=Nitrosomonas sp. (strain Is79A3) TaxID=261292 RepID=UPI000215CB58